MEAVKGLRGHRREWIEDQANLCQVPCMYPREGEGVITEELADESTETGDRRMRDFILRQLLTMHPPKK